MQLTNLSRAFTALALVGASNLCVAGTIPYGVFDKVKGNDYTGTIYEAGGEDVMLLAKVEGWEYLNEGDPLSSNGLTITGDAHNGGGDANEYIAGSWEYSGEGTIEWLVIKYGQHFGLYQITDGDTSGFWDIVELENFSDDDASGAKVKKDGTVHYSALSHAVAYGTLTPVPLPSSVWLLVSGVLGLLTVGRRRS